MRPVSIVLNKQLALDREYQQISDGQGEEGAEECGDTGGDGGASAARSSIVVVLRHRLDGLEQSVEAVSSRLEAVADKLDSNERSLVKRRDKLTRLLNPIIQVCRAAEQALIGLIRNRPISIRSDDIAKYSYGTHTL